MLGIAGEARGGANPPGVAPDGREAARRAALRRYAIMDTPPDPAFDRITTIAARLFDAPVCVLTLIDGDRAWFKSRHGVDWSEMPRAGSLCGAAMESGETFVISDACADPEVRDHPLVRGPFGLRFYAGAPLRTRDGHFLGALGVVDRQPRTPTDEQMETLADLAAVVMEQMELRLTARRSEDAMDAKLAAKDSALGQAEILAKEIDHRVMNGLQFVSAMLGMQAREAGDSGAAEALRAAASRVSAVARVHQHFYIAQNPAQSVPCLDYLRQLCGELGGVLGRPITVEGSGCDVPARTIGQIGMVVNELVTNAAKHGDRDSPITVCFGRDDTGACVLSVSDGGPGLPPGFDPEANKGLGMRVVRSLTQQLGGTLSVGPGPEGRGAAFTIRFTP